MPIPNPKSAIHNPKLQKHVRAINDCNQRGGRMLSLIDLIDAGTVDLPLAAYLAAAMREGVPLLIGARPGGAGKTAVMCALLNFLPDQTAIRAVGDRSVLADGLRDDELGRICYLAHEIGAGPYYAYVWGRDARDFFALAGRGHTIASNLHTDTLDETHDQLCRTNGVAPEHLAAVTLTLYLRVERGRGWSVQRRVSHVYESDGTQDRLLWHWDADSDTHQRLESESTIVTPEAEQTMMDFLTTLRQQDIRRIEDVRSAVITHATRAEH